MEIGKIIIESLKRKDTHKTFIELDKKNELEKVIPKVKAMKSVGECKYHVVNCFEHSINALKELEVVLNDKEFFPNHLREHVSNYLNLYIEDEINKSQALKLGIFLHDIGKPDSLTLDETGRVHFTNHEKIGAQIVNNMGTNLELSTQTYKLISKYVRYHMILLSLYKKNDLSKKELANVFNLVDEDTIGIILLGYADIVSTIKLLDKNEEVGVLKTYMEYILTNYLYKSNYTNA
ncbi:MULTISPECIES: HDIG domain-containing metalloprotein [unclassified Clostridioides]|uniref:HDIG domain-containing metalloprotein n=1 Tax=unclassified Clostridioides TaxID=2635829 RepID=UPI001D113AD2|nr:HD domain-containing protein [Clostridioides sp. ZZV15-6388]MCC0661747.1 HD domain-containing protein [Clostridioides sp. ZZV14-6154]MCC0662838.1 HD domain-containing protein [Clostridioides sp. ZZV15-6597]MCC0719285.1 HD domain-containing protein [Clostridioides sp. ZZV14-6105]WLD29863.1 CC-adding tRNA nucleotidyltransferase [Clostridioides difficile]